MNLVRLLPTLALTFAIPLLGGAVRVHAQTEGWLLGPNSNVGKESEIVPSNCVTSADGAISCDTKVVNPASDTPARPYYNPFNY